MKARLRWLIPLFVLLAAVLALYFLKRTGAPPSPIPQNPSASAQAGAAPSAFPSAQSKRNTKQSLRIVHAEAVSDPSLATGSFEGRVLSWATGQGVANASITFAHTGETSSLNTGADGTFRFVPREGGSYTIVLASAAGYLPFAPAYGESPFVLMARKGESIRNLTLYLTPAVQYLGIVQAADEKPIAGAQIQLFDEGGQAPVLSPLPDHFESNDKGEFTFSAPDGTVVEARHSQYQTARARVDLGVQASHRIVLRMKDKSAVVLQSIRGKAVDKNNAPIFGALISASLSDPGTETYELAFIPAVLSDETGAFTLEGTEPGQHYDISASFQDLAIRRLQTIPSGTENLVIQLLGGASISGTVRDKKNGAPLSAFTISVARADGPLSRIAYRSAAYFDAQGHYRMEGLGPGSYALFAAAEDYAPSTEFLFSIPDPAQDAAPIDIDLARGGKISGLVLEEETHAPLPGARVSMEGRLSASPSGALLSASAVTNTKGYFELGGLGTGLCSMTAVAAGHHTRILSGIQVPEGGTAGPLTIELAKTKDGEEPRIELTGIGAVLSAKDDVLVIRDVVPGGGAAEAGLVPGDTLLRIDGQSVVNLGFEQSIQLIRGPEGSQITLTVLKGGQGEPVLVTVTRRRIRR